MAPTPRQARAYRVREARPVGGPSSFWRTCYQCALRRHRGEPEEALAPLGRRPCPPASLGRHSSPGCHGSRACTLPPSFLLAPAITAPQTFYEKTSTAIFYEIFSCSPIWPELLSPPVYRRIR